MGYAQEREKRITVVRGTDGEPEFQPPESFRRYYNLLVEAVYMTRQPEPEVRTKLQRGGVRIPVRNYAALDKLLSVDRRLYGLKREIMEYLNTDPDEVSLAVEENCKDAGK